MRKLCLALVCFAATVQAATVELTWTHPTAFTDGSALAVTQIENTRVEVGTCASPGVFGLKQGEKIVPAPAAITTLVVNPGTWCYRAFTKALATAGGQESNPSAVVSNVVPYPKPNPPVLSTTVRLVYEVVADKWDGARLGRAVGSAELGTECVGEPITTQKGIVYEVPLDKVTLDKMPKSAIVATFCA